MPLNSLIHKYDEVSMWPHHAAREQRLSELREQIDRAWDDYWDDFAEAA